MIKTAERRTVLTLGEKITRVNIIDGGNAVEIFSISDCIEHQAETNERDFKVTEEYIEEYFPVVKASTLSLEDELLKHEPESYEQSVFKERLINAIKSGLLDFRAQRMDSSLDENGYICYQAGKKPVVGKSADWWKKNAKKFMPEKGSRLGTTKERIAFLGLLIKYLIEEQVYTVSDAWKAVCDQSKNLGHYCDSENEKHNLECSGSRQIGDWYDLANTYKITVDDELGRFALVGGCYNNNAYDYPLANVDTFCNDNFENHYGAGWIVLSK